MTGTYTVEIDSLPEEEIAADSPEEAARMVGEIVATRESLRKLPDDEPVQIKRPDRRPWGRNLTLGAFRAGPVFDGTEGEEGPVRPPSIERH